MQKVVGRCSCVLRIKYYTRLKHIFMKSENTAKSHVVKVRQLLLIVASALSSFLIVACEPETDCSTTWPTSQSCPECSRYV